MTLAWWLESVWRGAAVAAMGLGAYLVTRGLLGLTRPLLARARIRANHALYRLPFMQRRAVRLWRAEAASGTVPPEVLRYGAWSVLHVIDNAGGRERYRILTEYLEPVAAGEA